MISLQAGRQTGRFFSCLIDRPAPGVEEELVGFLGLIFEEGEAVGANQDVWKP